MEIHRFWPGLATNNWFNWKGKTRKSIFKWFIILLFLDSIIGYNLFETLSHALKNVIKVPSKGSITKERWTIFNNEKTSRYTSYAFNSNGKSEVTLLHFFGLSVILLFSEVIIVHWLTVLQYHRNVLGHHFYSIVQIR